MSERTRVPWWRRPSWWLRWGTGAAVVVLIVAARALEPMLHVVTGFGLGLIHAAAAMLEDEQ